MISIAPGRHGVTSPAQQHPTRRPPVSAPAPVPANTSAPCANADLVPTSDNIPQVAAATLCLVNQQRAQHGVGALRDNAQLDSSALHHSQDMVANNYYDHTSPTGETALDRIQATGYIPTGDAYALAENIDLGAFATATPAAIVAAWMNSPDHRAAILNSSYLDSGIGVVAQLPAQFAPGQSVGATYTQDFGAVESSTGVIS